MTIRLMNSEPMRFPLAQLSSVSSDAQHIYRAIGRKQKVDRDVFDDKKLRSYVSPEEAKEFEPTDRMLAAIAELERVRLAEYRSQYKSLYTTIVDDRYTVAYGSGSQLIRVSIFDESPDWSRLLAVIVGGDLETRESFGMPELSIESRHENATDFEHSRSITARLTLRNFSQPNFRGRGQLKLTGVLSSAHLYPIGTDPLAVSDLDTKAGKQCTNEHCGKPHPFAPYQPPEVESLMRPHFAVVEAFPIRPYMVQAYAPEPIIESETA
jgi:hypothetical protein